MRALALASLSLLACATAPQPDQALPAPTPAAAPGLDLAMTGGLGEADHVELAPGVYGVRSLVEAGEVGLVDLSPTYEAALLGAVEDGLTPPPPVPDDDGGIDDGGESLDYCYEYASDNYSDSTRNGTMFGGNPSWYGVVSAISYHDARGPRDVRSDYVSAYLYTSAPSRVDYAYAYGYVYMDGRYVGYIYDYLTPGTSAVAYGNFDLKCAGRDSVDISMTTYHYLYDGQQYLTVGNAVETTVACCP